MRRTGNLTPWVQKAEQDYAAVAVLSRKRRPPLPDVVCFHAQQCAEKCLKAVLVKHRVYFPKTHDLLELLQLATPHEPSLQLLKPFLAPLRSYAVMFRYPDEHATLAESRRVLALIRQVRERLRHVLGLSG